MSHCILAPYLFFFFFFFPVLPAVPSPNLCPTRVGKSGREELELTGGASEQAVCEGKGFCRATQALAVIPGIHEGQSLLTSSLSSTF